MGWSRPKTGSCADCGQAIDPRTKTGRCVRHMLIARNKDPEVRVKISRGRRAHLAKPGVRAALGPKIAAGIAAASEDSKRARSENGRRAIRLLHTPEVQARSNGPEAKRAAADKRTATMMGWCPPEWRPRYRELIKRGRRKAVAQQMVLAEIAAAEAARIAAMTPFERQMERVRNGAQLIAKPSFRKADPDFTLGGIATGML